MQLSGIPVLHRAAALVLCHLPPMTPSLSCCTHLCAAQRIGIPALHRAAALSAPHAPLSNHAAPFPFCAAQRGHVPVLHRAAALVQRHVLLGMVW